MQAPNLYPSSARDQKVVAESRPEQATIPLEALIQIQQVIISMQRDIADLKSEITNLKSPKGKSP